MRAVRTKGARHLTPRQKLLCEMARGWIGTPYRHQASHQGAGCDCLGLVRGLWRGLYGAEPCTVPSYSVDWAVEGDPDQLWRAAQRFLRAKPIAQARVGDVVLFRLRPNGPAQHLGVISALGAEPSFVHAYSGHEVTESPLSAPWQRQIVACFAFPPRRKRRV